MICELINPFDPYTFEAENLETAALKKAPEIF